MLQYCWRPTWNQCMANRSHMDIKAMMNKYSVWIDSMPRIPSPRWIARPEAGGVLDKPKASERDSLMDFQTRDSRV